MRFSLLFFISFIEYHNIINYISEKNIRDPIYYLHERQHITLTVYHGKFKFSFLNVRSGKVIDEHFQSSFLPLGAKYSGKCYSSKGYSDKRPFEEKVFGLNDIQGNGFGQMSGNRSRGTSILCAKRDAVTIFFVSLSLFSLCCKTIDLKVRISRERG